MVAPVRIAADRSVVDRGDSVGFAVEADRPAPRHAVAAGAGRGVAPARRAAGLAGRRGAVERPARQRRLRARDQRQPRLRTRCWSRCACRCSSARSPSPRTTPRYLDLESEPVPTDGDTLLLPAGTRLETKGEATAPLSSAAWETGSPEQTLEVNGGAFSGAFVPRGLGRVPPRPRERERRAAGRRHRPSPRARRGRQRPGSRDPGARRRHTGAAEPQGAAGGGRAGRLRNHLRRGREPPDQPSRHGGLRPPRYPRRSGASAPTARSSPTPSISTAAGCCPATRCATTRWRPTTHRSGRAGRSREFVLRLPTMSEVRAAAAGRLGGREQSARLDHGGQPPARAADGGPRPRAAARRLDRRPGRGGAVLRAVQAGGSRGEGPAGAVPAGRRAEAVARGAAAERRGGRRRGLGVAAAAPGDPGATGAGAVAGAARALGRAPACAPEPGRGAGQGSARAPGRGTARDAGDAGAQPGAVQARRAGGRPGQSHPGNPRAVAGAAAVERAGSRAPTARARRRRSASWRRAPTRCRRASSGWASRWRARRRRNSSSPPRSRPSRQPGR